LAITSGTSNVGNSIPGIGVESVGGASVVLHHVQVRDNADVGISDTGGNSLVVTRSTIDSNLGGGLLIAKGTFKVTNTFITRNGFGSFDREGGVDLSALSGTGSEFQFNTITENNANNTNLAGGIACGIPNFDVSNNL